MCYNAITGSAPSYLSELLHFYSRSRSLRSSSDTRMLKIAKPTAFALSHTLAPHLEQSPPRHLASFKSQLKTFLFSEYSS